jgi:hypothetical protein
MAKMRWERARELERAHTLRSRLSKADKRRRAWARKKAAKEGRKWLPMWAFLDQCFAQRKATGTLLPTEVDVEAWLARHAPAVHQPLQPESAATASTGDRPSAAVHRDGNA